MSFVWSIIALFSLLVSLSLQLKSVLKEDDYKTFKKLLSSMRHATTSAQASAGREKATEVLVESVERIRAHFIAIDHAEQWPAFTSFLPPSIRSRYTTSVNAHPNEDSR